MESRKRIVAGNWKMNLTLNEGIALVKEILAAEKASDVHVVLGTPFTHLYSIAQLIQGNSQMNLAAQNCHFEEKGAFTGEISVSMLQSVGANFVILGHSERRQYFGEQDHLIAKKVDAALATSIQPIVCVGEPLSVREAGRQEELVKEQIEGCVFHLDGEAFKQVVIAYEPVWAIGTGLTATPDQAQEMHAFIRSLIAGKYGDAIANATTIQYGGSCNPSNAKDLFAQPDVDGGLIGGASLKSGDFVSIINSFPK